MTAQARFARTTAAPCPPPVPLDAPTALISAALAITLAPEGNSVTREMRDKLAAALADMPEVGLASAWYHLVDIAQRYLRDHGDARLAPRFSFRALIDAAVTAGVAADHECRRWAQ